LEPEGAFGVVLRALRRERQLSQEDLALESGLQRNYVSLLERGLNSASLKTVFKLAKALDVSATEILRLTESELVGATRARQKR